MPTIEEIYPILSESQIITGTDWISGSKEIIKRDEYIIRYNTASNSYSGAYETVEYPASLYKCIDEVIVNACDHYIRQLNTKKPVTVIKISFDEPTGRITVFNDSIGIHIEMHPIAKMYIPQLILGVRDKGSNMKKSPDSITGGVNGLGSKAANAHSIEFTVETVRIDEEAGYSRYYYQKWTDNMEKVTPPLIIDLKLAAEVKKHPELSKAQLREHTTISFIPDYKLFNYPQYDSSVYASLSNLLLTRAVFAAAYVGKCAVYYNDVLLPFNNIESIASTLFEDSKRFTAVLAPNSPFPWDVTVVVAENKTKPTEHLTVVNGIVVKRGRHIDHLLKQIYDTTHESITKLFANDNIKFSPDHVYSNVFVFAKTQIPYKFGISWGSQSKTELTMNARHLTPYKFDPKFLTKVSKHLQEQIKRSVYVQATAVSKKVGTIHYDKYDPAEKTKTKPQECSLLLPEGDSACAMCKRGFGKGKLSHDYYGILTLGGVIMNVRKHSKAIDADDESALAISKQLDKNKFWNALIGVCGLNTSYRYDKNSPTYKAEMKKLRYGCVIACVDQDHDGIGFIFPLILNLFARFFPNLLADGYVKRFATPIKRAKPKSGGKIVEFFTEYQYNQWATTVDLSKYTISYLKGLGSNETSDVSHMFTDFKNRLFTYYPDAESKQLFEIMFGKDPNLRKRELGIPIMDPPEDVLRQQMLTKRVSCSIVMKTSAKEHAIANNIQTLLSAVDGMNESGRKILDGLMKCFKKRTEQIKVAQLTGFIADKENYHHGEQNLEENIKGKGFLEVGGVQLPQLIPLGEFGTRAQGGNDAAQARYIHTKLNKRLTSLIYPNADKYLLKYTSDEGKRGEPTHFVPIIPMAILESTGMPGTGWSIKIWAREVTDVLANIKYMIMTDDAAKLKSMRPYSMGFKGTFRTIRGALYSFGTYWYETAKNIVHITELPLRVWTTPYIEYIRKKKSLVEEVIDATEDNDIHIKVMLKLGAIEQIEQMADATWADGVEEYLELRDHMNSQLNFMDANNCIKEFTSYSDIIYYWFPIRKQLYIERTEREIILMELEIDYLENIIRFVQIHKSLDLVDKEESVAISLLKAAGFKKLNASVILTPKHILTKDLRTLAYGSDTDSTDCASTNDSSASYRYLLAMSTYDKLAKPNATRLARLTTLKQQLHAYIEKISMGRFPGAQLWMEELQQLENVIVQGRKTNWMFGEFNKYFY